MEVVNTFRLSEEIILFIFVPPLIFESALKGDSIQAGNIPPEFPTAEPLEVRFGNFLVQLFDGSSWVQQIQANLTANQYEYLTFISYACEQVPLRLRRLIKDSGLPGVATENCAHHYDQIRQEIIKQAQATVQRSPELAIAFQRKITDRVALVAQNQTIERLTSEGVISEAVASQILELIDFD